MPFDRIEEVLSGELADLREQGTLKGDEDVISEVLPAAEGLGPRYRLVGHGDQQLAECQQKYWHEPHDGVQCKRAKYQDATKVPEECSHLRYSQLIFHILARSHDQTHDT